MVHPDRPRAGAQRARRKTETTSGPHPARPGDNPWKSAGGRSGGSAAARPVASLGRRRHRQPGAALGPPPRQDRATPLRLHPRPEPVGPATANAARLIGALHGLAALVTFWSLPRGRRGRSRAGESRTTVATARAGCQAPSPALGLCLLEFAMTRSAATVPLLPPLNHRVRLLQTPFSWYHPPTSRSRSKRSSGAPFR